MNGENGGFMIKKLVWILIALAIILFILAYFFQIIVMVIIAVVSLIAAIYFYIQGNAQTDSTKQEIKKLEEKVDNLDASIQSLKPELSGSSLALINKLQSGDINLAETERLKAELEAKQKEINDKDALIAVGVVIAVLILIAYVLSEKK